MKNLYVKELNECKIVKSKPETIKFLMDYSQSLKINEIDGIKFESNLN